MIKKAAQEIGVDRTDAVDMARPPQIGVPRVVKKAALPSVNLPDASSKGVDV